MLVCALAILSCIAVRWLLPAAARLVLDMVKQSLALMCACLLLPEFWVSDSLRRRNGHPPHLAYVYANTVAGVFRFIHFILDRVIGALAFAARKVPPPLVAIAVVGTYIRLTR